MAAVYGVSSSGQGPDPESLVASPRGARSFEPARPGYEFEFPRDHGSHPDFRTEWWYLTGHLRSESGRRYGFELTFFRVGTDVEGARETEWDLSELQLAHFAITDVDRKKFRYYERLNRTSRFLAASKVGRLDVFNEGWSLSTESDGAIHVVASEAGDSIDLRLEPLKEPAIHGRDGVSVKASGEGYASHYYSFSRLEVAGTVGVGGTREACKGLAWMDHEFGSATLREYQQGWDWFSVQLDNEIELMLYVIRRVDGSPDTTSSGSIILSDGRVIHLTIDQFSIEPRESWTSRASGATYPMGWTIRVKPFDVELTLTEVMKEQELITSRSTQITYWEGAVAVSGRFGGTLVRGRGYVEMTGYDERFSN